MTLTLFYEDMHPAQRVVGPSIAVDRSEMIAFATTWDPLPFPIYLDGLDKIEQALPRATRGEIPGQRHLAPGRAPEAFAAVVMSFIADVRDENRTVA